MLLQNQVMLTDPAIQDEFRALIRSGGCLDLATPLTQFLHEQELLLTEDEIRTALSEAKKLLHKTLMLTLMPTEGCNFRCPYCYESHNPISMLRETLNCIQKYIIEQAPWFERIHINWFGGEPTLCKDVILETNNLVQELQAKHHFQFISNMTTNGYLLTEENFREYHAAGITSYQITLDGWDHDKTRPHVFGRGTLHTILGNLSAIAALPASNYPFHIVLRRNILAGDTEYTWYDYLNQLFGKDNRFSLAVIPVSNWGGKSVQEMNLLASERKKDLLSAHKAYIDKIGMQREKKGNALFSNICYASYPYGFVFRADGRIEKCTIAQNNPRNIVGHVDPNQGVVLNNEINHLWTASNLKSECCSCPDILGCLNLACRQIGRAHV